MLNRLRNNSLIAIVVGLLLWTPFMGFGQITIKEDAKAAKLTPDLFNLLSKDVEQKSSQQSKGLRQAALSTNSSSLLNFNRPLSLNGRSIIDRQVNSIVKQSLLNGSQLTSVNQQSSGLRQAALPDDDLSGGMASLMRIRNGMVAIDAVTNQADGQTLLNDLQTLGLKDGEYYQRIVSGYFPISKLGELRDVSTLHFARPAYRPIKQVGKVTSQGDRVMRSDVARQTYNVTGVGSKVGVMSDSYNALGGADAGVASSDLPSGVEVLKDGTLEEDSSFTDEGRGMAEIVYDVAPGTKLAFHTAFESYVDFALGIVRLANAGCNIIVDDVTYFFEPFFQDGIIAQAVDYVKTAKNVSYFSSAANQGRDSYSSPFHNSGILPAGLPNFPLKGNAHDFGNGKITQRITIAPGSRFLCVLQWSDPFYSEGTVTFPQGISDNGIVGARTDMDILIYRNGVLMPRLSSYGESRGSDPIEAVLLTNTTKTTVVYEMVLLKVDGPDPTLIKWINFGNGDTGAKAEFATKSSTIFGHPNAEGAIAVGASYYGNTPVYNARVFPLPLIESYSSAGGTPILFTNYGQPFPAIVRKKPEITAPDGGNTSFFYPGDDAEGDGFPNFFGTSAAAPHAAGVAALLQERAHNSMSPDDVKKRLEVTALDMDDPATTGFDFGFDFGTGYGFVQADKALMFGEPLVVLEPLYDCQTHKITLRTAGGDGTPITFTVPGVTRTPATTSTIIYTNGVDLLPFSLYTPASTTGIIEAGLLYDPKPLVITAMQSGVTATYVFDFVAYCNNQVSARIAASEPNTGLQVSVLGNPIASDWVEVEVRGIQGQPLKLQVNNTVGVLTSSRSVEMAESVERHKVSLGRVPGLYFLQVSTSTETKTIKIVRQ